MWEPANTKSMLLLHPPQRPRIRLLATAWSDVSVAVSRREEYTYVPTGSFPIGAGSMAEIVSFSDSVLFAA